MAETFASRLRALRIFKGMTQREFADRLGAGFRARLAHWETDRSRPCFNDLPRVAEALGVTTDFLLTGRESPQMEVMELRLIAASQEIAALRAPKRQPFTMAAMRGPDPMRHLRGRMA